MRNLHAKASILNSAIDCYGISHGMQMCSCGTSVVITQIVYMRTDVQDSLMPPAGGFVSLCAVLHPMNVHVLNGLC